MVNKMVTHERNVNKLDENVKTIDVSGFVSPSITIFHFTHVSSLSRYRFRIKQDSRLQSRLARLNRHCGTSMSARWWDTNTDPALVVPTLGCCHVTSAVL